MGKRFKKPKIIGKGPSTDTRRPVQMYSSKVTAGFPEFWDRVYDRYPRFFEVVGSLQGLVNRMLKLPVRGRLAQVVYFNAAIAANSFGALVTLVLNGYGHDATRIARGLYEAAVNALYLQLHPTEVDDFVDFNWVKQKRLYDYFQTLAAPDLAKLPQEALERLVSEYERVKEKFDNSRGKSRSTWCKKSLRQRAEEVDYGQYYPTFYAIASGIHHGDITGMLSQSEEDALTVTTPPSYEGIKMALMLAHNLLILAFKVLNEVSDFGMHHEISDAEEGFKRAWGTDR